MADLSMFIKSGSGDPKKRPDHKMTITDLLVSLESLIKKNPDKADDNIRDYLDGIQWDWYDSYVKWQKDALEVQAFNDRVAAGEDLIPSEALRSLGAALGKAHVVKPKKFPVEPVRPPNMTVNKWKKANYSLLRKDAYASIQDQLDMLYKEMTGDGTPWRNHIALVKSKYPK